MKHLRCVLILQFVTTVVLGQAVGNGKPASLRDQPEALVRNLYSEVVTRHPLGVPGGAAFKIFKPYLSKTMLHRIDVNIACQDDWERQHPDPNSKPPFLEFGLFSGDNLRAEPRSFQIERVVSEKDSPIRVYVKLTHDEPVGTLWTWRVAAILVREDEHVVVDDVIYLKDGPQDLDVRLSEYLSQGCDGPRWVGYGDRKNGQVRNENQYEWIV
jgi:hypothetical protein